MRVVARPWTFKVRMCAEATHRVVEVHGKDGRDSSSTRSTLAGRTRMDPSEGGAFHSARRVPARGGLSHLIVPLVLSLLVCPRNPSLAYCSRPPGGGGAGGGTGSLPQQGLANHIRKRPALMATVGSSTGLGQGDSAALCNVSPRSGGHARCVAGGASCKHWEGLSCGGEILGEIQAIVCSFERCG